MMILNNLKVAPGAVSPACVLLCFAQVVVQCSSSSAFKYSFLTSSPPSGRIHLVFLSSRLHPVAQSGPLHPVPLSGRLHPSSPSEQLLQICEQQAALLKQRLRFSQGHFSVVCAQSSKPNDYSKPGPAIKVDVPCRLAPSLSDSPLNPKNVFLLTYLFSEQNDLGV
uniref:Uncharacterized protein n=1 Tax=Ditylenchus dipsaci TaxID=166011 RepID=A0A915D6P0_9BILA